MRSTPAPPRDGRFARRRSALIRVTDDGIGMTAEELPLALERHATSKLEHDEDLDASRRSAFRGEALAAICAGLPLHADELPAGTAAGLRLAARAAPSSSASRFRPTPARASRCATCSSTRRAAQGPQVVGDGAGREPARPHPAGPGASARASARGQQRAARADGARRERPAPPRGRGVGHDVATRSSPWIARARRAVRGLASPPDLTRGNREEIVVIVNGTAGAGPRAAAGDTRRVSPAAAARPVSGGPAGAHGARERRGRERASNEGVGALPSSPADLRDWWLRRPRQRSAARR
jgi:hypothetical protein